MNKIIQINHTPCDYECMWNGIEDLYQNKSGKTLPKHFFFSISGIGNFVYLKQNKGILKRQASWNDGRTKQMYSLVCDMIGFQYKHIEGRTFGYAMKKAKEQIDSNKPVILGCLDMYYLKYYPKFYEQVHIPIHYVMMIGYDDEKRCAYILDCGVKEVQEISYELLEKALAVEKTVLSDKNAVCTIEFQENLKSVIEIAKLAFYQKAKRMLEPEVGFIGIKGMRKLAKEFCGWKDELTQSEYEEALRNIVMFSGTVPALPNRLLGDESDDNILHKGAREKLASVLKKLGQDYQIDYWVVSADYFLQSGEIIEKMTNQIVEYLLKEREELDDITFFINEIADIEEKGFENMLTGAKEK